ncbi:MAG: class I SAM-dependent methyltransferase, partial [Coprococcus sp.]
EEYVEYGNTQAQKHHYPAHFIQSDIREVTYENEFDVVLNMADGAIGYLENEEENYKSFKVISRALKPGGKHYMDIMSGDYANSHFPCKMWDEGEKGLTLSGFQWNSETKTMLYGQLDYMYGNILPKVEMEYGNPTRLYTYQEIQNIMKSLGMQVEKVFADEEGNPYTNNSIQMIVCSEKLR